MLRKAAKTLAAVLSTILVSPLILSERLCRAVLQRDVLFTAQAQLLSLFPGSFGSWLRVAYYHFTLAACPFDVVISFGSIFTHSEASLGRRVYVGTRCILGIVSIGDRTMLADSIFVLSGKNQHGTDPGKSYQDQEGVFTRVAIGRNCWIGTNTVIMADIGDDSIIGAGSVVTKAISANSRAVGNPARVLSSSVETSTATR